MIQRGLHLALWPAGALVFDPSSVTIAKGESVTFVNNAGFPHNVVFDEDEVPVGVAATGAACSAAQAAQPASHSWQPIGAALKQPMRPPRLPVTSALAVASLRAVPPHAPPCVLYVCAVWRER